MNNKILLTGFRNTSSELLLKDVCDYKTLLLPNDKVKDSEELIKAIAKEQFDFVISIGQKPNIKNKVYIETTARDGENCIVTNFDCDSFAGVFAENGISSKLSHNAGTSYCNQLYLNGLRHIFRMGMETQMIFVHIPFIKNIADFGSFRTQFFRVLDCMKEGQIWNSCKG